MSVLRICLVTAEVSPFAKTGGLGDVTGALARYLWRGGHDVRLFLPLYSTIGLDKADLEPVIPLQKVSLELGRRVVEFSLFETRLPGTELDIYLIDCPELYDREGIYTGDPDEHQRFALLCKAALECCQQLAWAPQVVHCNDWHTGLLPVYLKTAYAWDQRLSSTRTLLTIHNVGYQGVFNSAILRDLGLEDQRQAFDPLALRAGLVNFLSTGVRHADLLSTVSPTHALEIQTDEMGMGLGPVLRERGSDLVGILNGVDYEIWSPEHDSLIPHRFSVEDLSGKRANKEALLRRAAVEGDSTTPLIGLVSRLAEQKGIDLYPEVLPSLVSEHGARLVLLGSGETRFEEFFDGLHNQFPDRVHFHCGFDNELAHLIEAGSDMFLMPSRYEPCGLNQMYSLRYGTVPVVRRTGGLADSVEPFDAKSGEGTGFLFDDYTPEALASSALEALRVYRQSGLWKRLMANGMTVDFSWESQIDQYVSLYRRMIGPISKDPVRPTR